MSLLHPLVQSTLEQLAIPHEVLPCEEHLADTAEFCAHYGIAPQEACNTILVAVKSTPRHYVACVIRADTRLDVNHKLAAAVGVKRLSFASAEETAELTGMLIGGVTPFSLPDSVPIYLDERLFERPSVIVGGGNRSSKIRIDPQALHRLPNARAADIAIPR
ncbi:MAG TPA: YbaK/EbsC family protein [Thermoanaerobaculia bacterium]|nr:YbaK/EbsC family protein [Thermoanaerobaculia bacterium]